MPHCPDCGEDIEDFDDIEEMSAIRSDREGRYTVKYDHPLNALGLDPLGGDPNDSSGRLRRGETGFTAKERVQRARGVLAELGYSVRL